MFKNKHLVKMGAIIFIAFLCGTLAILWPQWREELEAKYGTYYGPPGPPPTPPGPPLTPPGPPLTPPGQLSDFPGSKVLVSGSDPVEMLKMEPTTYVYKIILNANFDNTKYIVDGIPRLFNVSGITGTCGKFDSFLDDETGITDIAWNLKGCNNSTSQYLTVTLETNQKPSNPNDSPTYEPKFCGPLYLNEGAYEMNLYPFNAESKQSNALFVAACLNESDTIGCVDNDHDGWTYDCGDCNDSDPSINPGAQEICGDGIDNNCDDRTDKNCAK